MGLLRLNGILGELPPLGGTKTAFGSPFSGIVSRRGGRLDGGE